MADCIDCLKWQTVSNRLYTSKHVCTAREPRLAPTVRSLLSNTANVDKGIMQIYRYTYGYVLAKKKSLFVCCHVVIILQDKPGRSKANFIHCAHHLLKGQNNSVQWRISSSSSWDSSVCFKLESFPLLHLWEHLYNILHSLKIVLQYTVIYILQCRVLLPC